MRFIGLLLYFLWFTSFFYCNARDVKKMYEVAYNDCGNDKQQPNLILGDSYFISETYSGNMVLSSCNIGRKIIYAFDRLDINADYRMEISFLSEIDREVELIADGNRICGNIKIPKGNVIKKIIDLPLNSFVYGQFVLNIIPVKGKDAVVSEIKLFSTNSSKLRPVWEEAKRDLKDTLTYTVDSNVNVEEVLPVYIPIPCSVKDVYKNTLSLNGTWKFSTNLKDDKWYDIQVPGQWSMQGFKVNNSEFVRYKKEFELPDDWQGKQVFIRFDGVHSEYDVFVNDNRVGYHLGGMTPYEVNVTEYLTNDKNKLSINVKSESLADMLGSLTQYAAHQLGGITRKVTMFAVPDLYISDLRIVTDLDDEYRDARLKLYLSVINSSLKIAEDVNIHASLEGNNANGGLNIPALEPGQKWSGWLELDVNSPRLWDNEHPNLYNLYLNLFDGNKEICQIKRKVGFREIEIEGNRVLVNGKYIKLRGVCRHEAHPLYGRSLTDEEWKTDAMLYRNANCNFIRTSHYPPADEFIEYCDELGLFVEIEAPICWIGHGANKNWRKLNYKDDKYYKYVLQADMETVHFYRNHPSVLLWSMANESYWNKGFAQVAEYMKKADNTRPFTFHDQAYGGYNNLGSKASIANMHYPGPDGYREAAKSKRPMVFGEFCHLNSYNKDEIFTDPGVRCFWGDVLKPMWENMYKTDAVLGGSIWSGIDDIFILPDGRVIGCGEWGPIDGWRRPKPEYWDMKKVYSPIKIHTDTLKPSNRLILKIENRYTFTDLNELAIKWKFKDKYGIERFDLKPNQVGNLAIETGLHNENGVLELQFVDPRGFVADEFLIPVGKQSNHNLSVPPKKKTKLKKTNELFILSGKNFECIIDRKTANIVSLTRNGRKILSGGPWLMVLPLNRGYNPKKTIYNDLCSGWKADSVDARVEGNDVIIKVKGAYNDFDGNYQLVINSNGTISVDYRYVSRIDVDPRQWGIVFETEEDFGDLFWHRDALWSVYPIGHIGRAKGEAKSFYKGIPKELNSRVQPTWDWSKDYNPLGSNDFRSTKRNIYYAGLINTSNNGKITVVSNGKQHWRSWILNGKAQFLVADFATAGNEKFCASHYAPFRKPIKKGNIIMGKIILMCE